MSMNRKLILCAAIVIAMAIASSWSFFAPKTVIAMANTALPLAADPSSTKNGAILGIQRIETVPADPRTKVFRLRYRSDGLAVLGYLLIPSGAKGRLPVLLFAHGGSGDANKIGASVIRYLSGMAARGRFVVLATDYRGTPGSEGRDAYGGSDVDDVLNLIPVAAKLASADIGNLFMLGFSRGGIDTYVAIGRGAPLRAAAVVSGPSDLAQTYRDATSLTRWAIGGIIGGSPQEKPEAYRARSALAWPEKLNVPLLILHGAKDDKVALSEVQALDRRLGELGKPHRLIVFAEGGHMLHNVADQRDRALLAWFKTPR